MTGSLCDHPIRCSQPVPRWRSSFGQCRRLVGFGGITPIGMSLLVEFLTNPSSERSSRFSIFHCQCIAYMARTRTRSFSLSALFAERYEGPTPYSRPVHGCYDGWQRDETKMSVTWMKSQFLHHVSTVIRSSRSTSTRPPTRARAISPTLMPSGLTPLSAHTSSSSAGITPGSANTASGSRSNRMKPQ